MKRPYIICHMMTSVDGRIDCAMTAQLPGVDDYYQTLRELAVPTTVSGRVTAELEMAEPGSFHAKNDAIYGETGFSKKADAKGYEIVVDTRGKLLWPDATGMSKPYLIITSEQVSKEYLDYLDGQNISWIVCGKERIDLVKACEILATEFGVERMGIDGTGGMPAVFDGRAMTHGVTGLKLMDVKRFASDAVWIRYRI